MNLYYAVDRLYDTGWMPWNCSDVEQLNDGRKFPALAAIEAEFSQAGLKLCIKQNLMFSCYRATWAPIGEPLDENSPADEMHGTVIGSCDREAAVYALAQLRAAQAERQFVNV